MRSAAAIVIAHFLNGPLTRGIALANFLMSMYALWAYTTKVGGNDGPFLSSAVLPSSSKHECFWPCCVCFV